MTLRARWSFAALAFAGLALYTESAHADAAAGAPAPPSCAVTLGGGAKQGVTLPSNAPALLVVTQSSGAGTATLDAELVNGTTRTALVESTDTHGLWTLALPAPSVGNGTYNVEVTATCPQISDQRDTVATLTLTAPVDFPTSVGTLVHVPTSKATGTDKIRLEPTANLRAFLPAARLDLVVGGTKHSSLAQLDPSAVIELTVNTGDACVENGALHREKRVVKVTLEGAIAGLAESPAPASLDIPIDCGAIEWTSGLDLDGKGSKTSSSSSSGSPGSTTSNGTTYTSSSGSDGGCSTSPVGTRGSASGLVAFALGALALAGKRRRSR